ncbi:DUF3426 domain-containing protein [Pseudomonas sp. v388]|uniref:DUF3426 domain-containing protein n=1 Tax=Pseudomonas sp. v388 TaxID=2479849 RepID=UPI000F776A5B|nr:DUF3426 domain-containing protein [Pseudomonas sp. v388]RRV09547.1 DUF3426 domain-containing protein [Pseudomonas sp. v388]
MTDSFVTQCPHCQTSFRVSHAQLSVARGVVRCGACLQVFNAARQLLEQRSNEEPQVVLTRAEPQAVAPVYDTPALATREALPPAPAVDEDPWHVSELDLDNLNLDEELARLEKRDGQHNAPRPPAIVRGDETSLTARRDTPQTEQASWVDSLRNDEVERLPELQAEVIPDPEPQIETDEHDEHDNDVRTEPSLGNGRDIDDDEHAVPAFGPRISAAGEKTEKVERWSARDDDDDLDDQEPEVEPDSRSRRARNEPAVREQALLDLNDDPLQLDWQRPRPRWGRRLAWGLLILLALAGLASQYIWYHFDQLARQDQYRPWFQQLCPQLGCKVPSKVDISLLKSSNLVVRSHPEFQGALVVDAIIYNRAAFSQPFPLLELRFADTGGQLIASRRFKPSEYLSGEMAGKEEMPPQTPIHIALDILDPGAKAVNYSLYFRSPE